MAGALTAAIAAAFAGSAAPSSDQYFEYTTLLLPGNGTNGAQNNTFLDGSTNNFTITRNGNTTQGTFSPFSQTGWGNYFAGSQSISIAATTALQYSGDFTIECWFYKPATGDATTFIQQSTNYFSLNVNPGTGINIYLNSASANFVITDRVPQINTWHHIALVRSGSGSGNIKCYLDGVASSTTATNTSTLGYNAIGYLGAIGTSAGGSLVGYISNFRIVSGRAVYTSNFTPPALPLTRTTGGTNPPQGSETIWLTAQSNRFLDSNGVNTPASSPLTITANGSPTVVAFSPFNPTASWSAATYGGSGYFDGSGDYLTVPSNSGFAFGTGDYTIEYWIYLTNSSAIYTFDFRTGNTCYAYFFSGNMDYAFGGVSGSISGATTSFLNSWVHIAATRSSGTFRLFVNGVQQTSTSDSTNWVNSGLTIGSNYTANQSFIGYISNFRTVKGTAVYTSNFTPPTAPLTAITNTSLLLNFTNAGIYDATSKNDLETVGNAQISTAISAKWGSGSMYFDGAGDYLNFPSSQLFGLGTGDFTIEFWLYLNTVSGTQNLCDFRNATATEVAITLYMNLASPRLYVNGADRITGGNLSTGQWYHVALTRSSTSTKLFVGGTQSGSTYTDSNNYLTPRPLRIGMTNDGVIQFPLNAYIQDFRVTLGYARYTANFTAPTAAFPTL